MVFFVHNLFTHAFVLPGGLWHCSIAVTMVIKGRDKFKVPVISRFHDREQLVEAVNAFFQWGLLFRAAAVPVLHVPFHPESPDIITGDFYPQDTAKLVVHFDRYITHMVFDPGSKDPLVIVGPDFFLAVVSDTLPKESGDIIRFYCVYGCTDDIIVKGFQIGLLFEHDVSGAFNLLDSPCVSKPQAVCSRTVAFRKNVKDFVQVFWIDTVRNLLCGLHIRNL